MWYCVMYYYAELAEIVIFFSLVNSFVMRHCACSTIWLPGGGNFDGDGGGSGG